MEGIVVDALETSASRRSRTRRPVEDLFSLSLRESVRLARNGTISVEALVRSHLDRIAEVEPGIGAWQHLDEGLAIASARKLDMQLVKSTLHGALFGVKDVIVTADMPTAYGSLAYAGNQPTYDASCVAIPRAAGALMLGKTVTTEFAALAPGYTRNPYNAEHTPGGSSSGSAAAVAAKMIPVALGTQTAGSTIRPASFCGVVGYKPSYGMIDATGVKVLAAGLDTVGIFARHVRDAAFFAAVLSNRPMLDLPGDLIAPKVGIYMTEAADGAEPETLAAIERARRAFEAKGAIVRHIDLVPGYDRLLALHAALFDWAMLEALSYERLFRRGEISEISRKMFADREASASIEAFDAARAEAAAARAGIDRLFGDCNVLLTPSAPGEAPMGLESTGDSSFNRGWSLLQTPCINVPVGSGPNEMPVGVQIVGRPGADATTLAAAAFLEAALGDG